ncbi:Major facilitator superfamily domain general substrate transporter protein [Rutstroemia sp. NJR-2017a BBW]|nr:Major facilitator superfamily domain general substrate transporter protein [Rutstroemia sp. NJR-2017a BBW]
MDARAGPTADRPAVDFQEVMQPEQKSSEVTISQVPQDQSIDSENEVTGIKLILIHAGICMCTFIVGLDFNLIATAVPAITSHFNSIDHIGWYGSAFYIALCASQPLAGKTFTLFPKKISYLLYLALFEIGSLLCALAPTSSALIGGRAIAGLGASGLFAGGFVLLTTIIPLHKRAIWTGTMSSFFAIASIVGPVLGGALTENLSWRWCFYINLPIGGFAAILVASFFSLKPADTENLPLIEKLKGLDSIGFTLFSGSVTMLLLALQWGGTTYAWKSSVIICLLIGSAVIMGFFIPWQLHQKDAALIPPKLFTHRNVILIFTSSLFVNGPFQTIVYRLPIWLLTCNELSMQASLPADLVPIGATTLLFGISMSCAVFLAIGQAVFQQRLQIDLENVVSQNVTRAVISAGATRIRSIVSADELPAVLQAYSKAVTQVFLIPAAAPILSFI